MKGIIYIPLMLFGCIIANAQKDTVITKSGLKYIQTMPGNGIKPVDGQKLKVYYKGTLKDETVFDTNMSGNPFKFVLGKNEVIPGWEEGFKLMSAGEKGYLIIPAKLAYGSRGIENPNDVSKFIIPPNSDLIFEVKLVSFK